MKKISLIITMLLMATVSFPAEAATSWSSYRIMIDPGHGGTDPGASGPSAPHEATLALRCGLALKNRIVNECGGTVKMTRSTDTFISLSARKSASVSYDPYIFCSIHLNAYNGTAKGTETYYYWTAGNSSTLANKVHAQLIAQFKTVSGFTPTNRGVKTAAYTVITGSSSVPAILTEGLFVDNSTEWSIINSESKDGFKKWVQGHLYGFYDRLVLLNSSIIDPSGTTTETTTPTWTVSPTEWAFTCVEGATSTVDVTIKGSNLTATPTASISGTGFTIASSSLTSTGGTVKVQFAPTNTGSYSGTLTLKSGALSQKVTLTGTATSAPLTFVEKWNSSDQNSTLSQFGWNAGSVRNMTYNAGKLYLVYNHSDIKVVNAQTGADLGNLNKDGVTDGTLTLCDVKYCDGKIVACNLAVTGQSLKVYVWDNDQSNPRVVLNTTEFGGATRIGDYIGFYGTWTNGKLVFGHYASDATRIISYAITNGTVATTPTIVNATTDGTTILSTGGSTRIYPGSDYYWIDGKNNHTTRLGSDGIRQYYIDTEETWGTAFQVFTWKDTEYGIAMTFNTMEGDSWSAQTDEQKAKNYTGGRMKLFRNDSGWSKPTDCGDYPSAGLSSTVQNTNCTGNVIASVNGTSGVEAWVLSTGQGIGYYLHGTAPTYTVEEIKPAGPNVTASKTDVNLSAYVGESTSEKITITGTNLTDDISITLSGENVDQFSVSATTISQTSASGEITITYSPTEAASHSASLTISSTDSNDVTITLKGTGENKTYTNDDILSMTKVWEYGGNSTTASWMDLTTNITRHIAQQNSKLYILNCKSWAAPIVNIVNAYTGEASGSLDMTGIQSATIQLSNILAVDGKIIGSNAVSTTQVLRVYRWDSDTSAPVQILEDATHEGVATGAKMSISGNLTNGSLIFTDATNKVLFYTITNGTVATTPTVVSLTKNGEAVTLKGSRGEASVQVNSDGTMWIDGQGLYPAKYSANGEWIEDLPTANLNSNGYGTETKVFTFGEKLYAASVYYIGNTESSLTNGAFVLNDITNGATSAVKKCAYPENGLGATKNDQNMTSICQSTRDDGSVLDIWVCANAQGVAHYTYNGKTVVNIDNITSNEAMSIMINRNTLTILGVEINSIDVLSISGSVVAHAKNTHQIDITSLSTGIYIVKIIDNSGMTHTHKIIYNK